jgi:hypothetical protein
MERPVKNKHRCGFFIDCHEKVPQVERMCKRVNYKDMMFIIEFSMNKFDEVMHLPPAGQHIARVGIKFGDGLIGKGAEIRKVTSITEW